MELSVSQGERGVSTNGASNPSVAKERTVYGYIRVSTKGQATEGVSLESQEQAIKAFAALKATTLRAGGKADEAGAWDAIEILADRGKSARTVRNRPALDKVRRAIREGRCLALVVFKVDRASRSLMDLLNLVKECQAHETAFASVVESIDTSTSMGKFLLQLLGSLAELESSRIGERTALSLRTLREQGKRYSAVVPFGWKVDGERMVPVEREQVALASAKAMLAEGKSYRFIAKSLDKQGIRGKQGGRWYAASVRNVLRTRMATEAQAS
jgi:site-specific DNA recombinase